MLPRTYVLAGLQLQGYLLLIDHAVDCTCMVRLGVTQMDVMTLAGLESVELLMSKDWPGQNRGFCFLEFYNHACAQAAKAALSPPNFQCDHLHTSLVRAWKRGR